MVTSYDDTPSLDLEREHVGAAIEGTISDEHQIQQTDTDVHVLEQVII